jgi:FkbH-like protein
MQALNYPFDAALILAKRKRLRRELLENDVHWLDKKVAILGGSTTHDIKEILELFLLNNGIRAEFYESEYALYREDALYPNAKLDEFKADIIYVHTASRNISAFPQLSDSADEVTELIDTEYNKFVTIWESLREKYDCPIIQNNFEYPFWRLMGNRDASDIHGRVNFVTRLNIRFAEYAQNHGNFYINDINWLSADCGLEKWSDPYYWYMYKYSLAIPCIPRLTHSVANIIKSIYGKNKKAFALDLDNTLWGGIVGDDGAENLQIGQETPAGQVYSEFQQYLKAHKKIGVILNVISKNENESALDGLNHPGSTLKPDDFISIKTNWEPKSENLVTLSNELSLLPESFVFVDDNPAEREIVLQQVPNACVPGVGDKPERYIIALDRSGYFETTTLTSDDAKRTDMYKENAARSTQQASFTDYGEYLKSLEMNAEIGAFAPVYMSRIAQLTNKSNQFNLTTKRYTRDEIEAAANDPGKITLYGKLSDKFGDNGVVTVVIGEIVGTECNIALWLMSCRVIKRGMEPAVLDELVKKCKERGVVEIKGYFYPTAKNSMVRDFYDTQGFTLDNEDSNGSKSYTLDISGDWINKNKYIDVTEV